MTLFGPFCASRQCALGARLRRGLRSRRARLSPLFPAHYGGRSRGKGLIYASRQFVALLLTPPAGPPLPTGAAFAAMPCSFRGPQSRPLYQRSKELLIQWPLVLIPRGRSFLSRTFPAPCGLGVRSALFFCRGRSLRPAGLESACRARSRGKGLIYASRQFVALLLTPPAGPPLPTGAAFAAMPYSFRGPQSRPLYQPIKRVVDSGR